MENSLENTLALLARTPATLNALLRDLPAAWTHSDEGPDTWTAAQVIGHLIHCERTDWLARARRTLESGESRAFDPLDRTAHLKGSPDTPLSELLDEFANLRTASLNELNALHLGPTELSKRGLHPALGPLPLSELLAAWAVHDLTHLHQISRILAYQYREAVGPFATYLGVLKCNGHSG